MSTQTFIYCFVQVEFRWDGPHLVDLAEQWAREREVKRVELVLSDSQPTRDSKTCGSEGKDLKMETIRLQKRKVTATAVDEILNRKPPTEDVNNITFSVLHKKSTCVFCFAI